MTIDEIRDSIKDNLQSIDRLAKKLKIDIENAQKKKAYYDQEIREYDKIRANHGVVIGVGFLLIWMELRDKIKRDQMKIKIADAMYDLSDLSNLHQVATERYQIISKAKREGVELTDEAKEALANDKIAFLLSEKEQKVFAGDKEKTMLLNNLFAAGRKRLSQVRNDKKEEIADEAQC